MVSSTVSKCSGEVCCTGPTWMIPALLRTMFEPAATLERGHAGACLPQLGRHPVQFGGIPRADDQRAALTGQFTGQQQAEPA